MRAGAALALAACLLATPAQAQDPETRPAILIVDREKVLRDSAAAQRLGDEERRARLALRDELDALRAELEAEEAEIAALRDGSQDVFEARVRAFDLKVREARQASQRKSEALQKRFAEARRRLSLALEPVLQAIMAETGASLILDARNVLAARQGANVTAEAIARLNARAPLVSAPEAPSEGE